jgi:hypothetical protein
MESRKEEILADIAKRKAQKLQTATATPAVAAPAPTPTVAPSLRS